MRKIKAGEGILRIGKNGEQEALGVFFPVVKNWEGLYGTGGTWELSVQRAGDEMAYSAEIDTDAENVRWIVSDVDVSKIGEGRCELVYRLGGTIAKSRTYAFVVEKSLTGGAELPDPVKDWKDGIEKAIDEKIDRPAGGEIGDVLTKTEDGEEWKPGGSEDAVQYVPQTLTEAQQKQARENIGVINADWNQNDNTKADYIKNRGAYQYAEKQIKSEDFISGNHISGEIVAIPDENDKFLKSLQMYDKLFGSMPWIGYTQAVEIYCDVTTNGYSFTEKMGDYFNPQKYESLGGSNRKTSETKGNVVYFILDISTLNDEYAGKFAKNGIYGSYDKSKDSNNTTKLSYIIKLTYQHTWKEKFIPSNIERTTRKVADMSGMYKWSGRDDFYPSVAAMEEYVAEETVGFLKKIVEQCLHRDDTTVAELFRLVKDGRLVNWFEGSYAARKNEKLLLPYMCGQYGTGYLRYTGIAIDYNDGLVYQYDVMGNPERASLRLQPLMNQADLFETNPDSPSFVRNNPFLFAEVISFREEPDDKSTVSLGKDYYAWTASCIEHPLDENGFTSLACNAVVGGIAYKDIWPVIADGDGYLKYYSPEGALLFEVNRRTTTVSNMTDSDYFYSALYPRLVINSGVPTGDIAESLENGTIILFVGSSPFMWTENRGRTKKIPNSSGYSVTNVACGYVANRYTESGDALQKVYIFDTSDMEASPSTT